MSCLPKPVLRGYASRYRVKSLLGGLVFSSIIAGAYYFIVAAPKQRAFEEFFKTYDPEAHYKELVKYGFTFVPEKKEED